MFNKYLQQNQADQINKLLNGIDLTNANTNSVEKEIYSALTTITNNPRWSGGSITPLAQPTSLSDLLDDLVNGSRSEILYQANRVDNIYQWLSDTNNVLQAELTNITTLSTNTSDAVQNITQVTNYSNYYWVTDNFNSTVYIDSSSTAFVNTDSGYVTLQPSSSQTITSFTASIDTTNTNGIPGCNLLVLSLPANSSTTQAPAPVLDTSTSYNFNNMFDGDSTTWFEVERNFVTPTQPLVQNAESYVYSVGAKVQNVLSVTKNYDWKVIINWPDYTNSGPDGQGVSKAEFTNLNGLTATSTNYTPFASKLIFTLNMTTPTPVSSLNITPFIRPAGAGPVNIDSISITLADSSTVNIIQNVVLGSNDSNTTIQQKILTATNTQTTGSNFSIPTNQNISAISFAFSSLPVEVPLNLGLAHQYASDLVDTRSDQAIFGFINIVNHSAQWDREPLNTTPPNIQSYTTTSPLFGTIASAATTAQAAGLAASALNTNKQIANALSQLGITAGGINAFNTITSTVASVANFITNAFSHTTTQSVSSTVQGYDIFQGWRSAIAIKDITLSLTQYTTQSVLVSVKRVFNGAVNAVGLFVEEDIPTGWGAGNWIQYYVSEDNSTWTLIIKLTSTNINQSYIPSQPIDSIYFKAVLNPNTADPSHTAYLNSYSLLGRPA